LLHWAGELTPKEVSEMMKSMGMMMNPTEEEQMFVTLDKDGGGSVSLEEFLEWHFSNEEDEAKDMEEMAEKIFKTIDVDGSGDVTVAEFVAAVDKLNSGLSIDEITAIVRDFDESGDGSISLEEFQEFIKKAYES